MARTAKYQLVDVFTQRRFGGNQLAVFLNGSQVHENEMLTIARELNLSETTFVFPPEEKSNDFKVRIFTPGGELPMAGHPTIGTAFLLAKTMVPSRGAYAKTLKLEEGVGVIPVEINMENGQPTIITMTMPDAVFHAPLLETALFAELIGINEVDLALEFPIQTVSCGVPYLFIGVKSLAIMKKVKFRLDVWDKVRDQYNPGFVYVFCMETELPTSHVHGRMFAPEAGILEDPATGSANGPLGAYLVKHGIVKATDTTTIISEQGFEMGRPSILYITVHRHGSLISKIELGGYTVAVGQGELILE